VKFLATNPERNLQRRFEDRHKWINAAFKEYESSMSPEVREMLSYSPKLGKAIVWGPTQQGKSTLIFDLLGVDSENEEFKHVLRAGSGAGQSVTPVPTFYYVEVAGTKWKIDDEEMESSQAREYFVHARDNIGELSHDKPVRVRIPEKFVDNERKILGGILDIPGLSSASSVEEVKTAEAMEKYIKDFPMVLIVHEASKLSSIVTSTSKYPALRGWDRQPDRFRLVLTHGFTELAVQRLSHHDAVMNYYGDCTVRRGSDLKQILGERWRDVVVPLELGSSVKKLKNSDLQAANSANRARIIDDLLRAQEPRTHLNTLRKSGDVVRKHYKDKLAAKDEELDTASSRYDSADSKIRMITPLIEELELEIKTIGHSKDRLAQILKDFRIELRDALRVSFDEDDSFDTPVEFQNRLDEQISKAFGKLKAPDFKSKRFREAVKNLEKSVTGAVDARWKTFLKDIQAKDRYWFGGPRSAKKIERLTQENFESKRVEFFDRLGNLLKDDREIRKEISQIRAASGIKQQGVDLGRLEIKRGAAKIRMAVLKRERTKATKDLLRLEGERADICALEKKDIAKLPKLDEIISQSVKKERTRLNNQLLAVQDRSLDAPYNYAESLSMLSFIHESRQLLGAGDSRG
jgi:hypothetical protein